MPDSSSSKVLVISGASRGLGLAFAQHFLAQRWRVLAFSRNTSPAIDILQTDETLTDRFYFARVDVADDDAVRHFVSAGVARFGQIDALVNNAGTADDQVLAMQTTESIDRMLGINIRGALLLAKECVRHMLLRECGAIVNVASVVAQRGFSGLTTYAATKAALLGMTYSLARELGPRGIRVNAVSPGFVETEMSAGLTALQREQIIRRTPLARLATVEDVVQAVDFLLSPAASFITGQNLVVDGGASV